MHLVVVVVVAAVIASVKIAFLWVFVRMCCGYFILFLLLLFYTLHCFYYLRSCFVVVFVGLPCHCGCVL